MVIEESVIRKVIVRVPWLVIQPIFMIIFIGIINISSAAQATRPDLYLSQASKFAMAIIFMAGVALVHTRVWRRLCIPGYLVSLLLLLAVLFIGTSVNGSKRWLVYGPLRMQPSDPAKIALILALAGYCSKYWPLKGYTLKTLIRPLNISRPLAFLFLLVAVLIKGRHGSSIFPDELLTSATGFLAMGLLFLIGLCWLFLSILKLKSIGITFPSILAPIDVPILPFFLISAEPDLGTGLIVLAISGLMFLYVGIRRSSLIFGIIGALIVGTGSYFTVLKEYQRERLESFIYREADVHGKGYQAMQSKIAIGSGGFLGKGFKGGTQTQLSFLPENATDFVFSVWAEEWGFVSCVFLLTLYLLLLRGIFQIAGKVEDHFSELLCIGIASSIFLHVFINIGMVMGLMPVVGVPLPFMSYGGSSLLMTMIGIGLVVNVAIWRGAK